MTDQFTFDPWQDSRRIVAVVGHYGSGKTEIALNLAISAAASGHRAAIVDMDIVNPFFRSAEQHALLERRGVALIQPTFALTGVDIPVLPAEINRVFVDKGLKVVLDIGGEDAGAAALGGYKRFLDQEPIDMYYVVNLFRPFSENADQIMDLLGRIERRARIAPTGLINNGNLAQFSTPDEILRCQDVLRDISRRTGLPIRMITGTRAVLEQLPPDVGAPLYPIERYLVPEWMEL